MRRTLRRCAAVLLLASACGREPDRGILLPLPAAPAPAPLGIYEIDVSGIGGGELRSTVRPARLGGLGPRAAMAPLGAGIVFEPVASSSFTDGTRTGGGQRYVSFTYRVRNGTGVALNNLTLLMVSRAGTVAGTPVSALKRLDGTPADPAIAPYVVPTGAVAMRSDLVTLQALDPDVLQVFQESEVAAIAPPGDVTSIFPYGYVVRGAQAGGRAIPAAATATQYDGVLTLAFRLPLQATSAADVFAMTLQVLAVQDGETRMTESMEEAQDSSAVRRLRERAAAIGATTVTVLAGSPASGPDVADYPGQRQVCTVRTAGTAAMPVNYITTPAGYSRLALLRPGESAHFCRASFRSGTPQLPELNVPYPITVRAVDRYGNLMGGTVDTVRLAQASGPAATLPPAVALVSGQATLPVTYQAYGTSLLEAAGLRLRGQRVVEVATAATVAVNGGGSQAAMAGTAVPTAPSVLVRDLAGRPLAGVPVAFAVALGGGSVTGAATVTDANGVARAGSWVLGSQAALNTLSVTAAGAGAPVTFTASGCAGGGGAGYGVTLCYTSALTAPQRAAFEAAAARWQELVTRDAPDVAFGMSAGGCGGISPAFELGVDDLLIFAGVESIDGPGGILGSAAPCVFRAGGGLPILGQMRFDAADLATMEGAGLLQGVILHEMGHVLGIGSRWPALGLVVSPSQVGGPAADTHYTGAQGIAGFDLVGGAGYTGGQKVPVENTGAGGTINAHWRESLLATELMTGYVNAGAMPLSQLTVRSLADLGYTVDPSKADPFFLSMSAGTGGVAPGAIPLVDDVDRLPWYEVDANGRTTRVP